MGTCNQGTEGLLVYYILVSLYHVVLLQPLTDFAVVKKKNGNVMTPIFITCDPARDTPPVVSCISFTEPRPRIDIGPII